jgi:hypothetical protein
VGVRGRGDASPPKLITNAGEARHRISWWVIVGLNAKPGTDLSKESLFGGMTVPFGVVFGIAANVTASRITAS